MALENYLGDMNTCTRCSLCKFIPMPVVKNTNRTNVCPSIARYEFYTYCGGGRMAMGIALAKNKLEYTDRLLDAVYNCQMCGACDISCKYGSEFEVLDPIHAIRVKCIEDKQVVPALEKAIKNLRENGTLVTGARAKRGKWAEGLGVNDFNKQKTDVVFHAGCLISFNKNMWEAARVTIRLLQKAGVEVGIGGDNESCCGGRAYQMGYVQDFLKQAKLNMDQFKKAGMKTLITGCADGYHAFKVLYDKFNLKGTTEVWHTSEYLSKLLEEGKLKPNKKVPLKVTYHDPCHLGRLGEPFIHWQGKQLPGHMRLFDPPKILRRGTHGIYEPPRNVLRSIPGLNLVEMDRIKEYAWCCGAGGGVNESNPEYSLWTAKERINEAESTGAEAIVTTCPWCIKNFNDAIKATGSALKVYDLVELLDKAIK